MNIVSTELISNVLNDINSATMSKEDLAKLIGEHMRRTEVEQKYGDKIKHLKDGRWYIRIDGKMIRRCSREKVIDAIMNMESDKNTLEAIAPKWLRSRMLSRSGGTYRRDIQNYERFIKGTPLAKMQISEITLSDGYDWTEWLLKEKPDMKMHYWRNVHGTLNSLLAFAGSKALVDLQIHRDRLAHTKKKTSETRIFFDDEKKAVKKLAYEDAENTKTCMPLGIPLIFCTGIRDGELCALHWRDIEGEYLHIQEEMVEDSDEAGKFLGYKLVDHCKSESGDRLIKISKETKHILHLCRMYNFASGIPIGEDDYIFARRDKSGEIVPCTTRSFECRIKKYCKHANMTELKSQHDARRTFATDCFYANMPLKNLQELLGHSTLKQTQDYIYTKPCQNVDDYLDAINM